jgi:hypothetical protein
MFSATTAVHKKNHASLQLFSGTNIVAPRIPHLENAKENNLI